MAIRRVVVGLEGNVRILSRIRKTGIMNYLTKSFNFGSSLIMTLIDYLVKYSKKIDQFTLSINVEPNRIYPNGTLTGLLRKINQSRIDIGIIPFIMDKKTTEIVDFSYPYEFTHKTFMTRKPEFKSQMFGILQTFSLPTWIAIMSILLTLLFVYNITFRKRSSIDKVLFHIFAVLLRQSLMLKPSSASGKLFVYAWVVGAMFLCLAYESTFFSFLTIPTLTQIKDVSQLAQAVESGKYHCISNPRLGIVTQLLHSERKNLRIIGKDLKKNNLSNVMSVYWDRFRKPNKKNLALLVDTKSANLLSVEGDFVSDDHFLETMAAMMVRKDFCCKRLLDIFVHRMKASGIYDKQWNDYVFFSQLSLNFKHPEKDNSQRKLTLIDVAPAFLFLILGHIISILIFIGELLENSRIKMKFMEKN